MIHEIVDMKEREIFSSKIFKSWNYPLYLCSLAPSGTRSGTFLNLTKIWWESCSKCGSASTHTHMHTQTCRHAHTHAHADMHTHMHVQTYMNTDVCTHAHTCRHADMHTYAHTCINPHTQHTPFR